MELYPLQIDPNSRERTDGHVDRKKCSYAYASLFRKCAFGAKMTILFWEPGWPILDSARDESVLWSQMGDRFAQIALKTLEIG